MGFDLASSVSILITLVVGLSFHEFGHAAMATKLGDPTPRLQGRLTLNPMAHLDMVGGILLLVMAFARFGFAYGKPVQTNPMYYKDYRFGRIAVALAGPAMNLCLAMLAIALGFVMFSSGLEPPRIVGLLILWFIIVNFLLMLFNLLPIPPLDGSHVLEMMLPWDLQARYRQMAGLGMILILILWFTGVLGIVFGFLYQLVFTVIALAFGQDYVLWLISAFG